MIRSKKYSKIVFKGSMYHHKIYIMTLSTKIEYVFNKILLNLLKEIKDKDLGLKKKIKENYAVFDKSSATHMAFFTEEIVSSDLFMKPYLEDDILSHEEVRKFKILKNIEVSDILSVIDTHEKDVIKCYLYILFMLSNIHTKTLEIDEDDGDRLVQMNELFQKCLKMIKSSGSQESFDEEMDNVFDEEICVLFKNIYESRKHIKDSLMRYNNEELDGKEDQSAQDDGNPLNFLQNSKIGQLAQEITKDIEIDKLNINDPSELLNVESILSGENSALGDIISKVGNKVAAKISSGELKHEDLLSEAMSMMGKLNGGGMGGNGFMEEMMKSAMNAQGTDPFAFQGGGPTLPSKPKNKRRIKK